MAQALGLDDDVLKYKTLITRIESEFYKNFWKGNAFYNSTENGEPDDRANALAMLAGVVHKEDWKKILTVFQTTFNSSPYMEKYVLDALCEMGFIEDALQRIKIRYYDMVEDAGTTLWEYWNKNGTRNHAWSGGPLIILKKFEGQVIEYVNKIKE